jgi:hypothetical protein
MKHENGAGEDQPTAVLNSKVSRLFAEITPKPVGLLAYGEWIHSPHVYHQGAPRPVCVVLPNFDRVALRPLSPGLRELWQSAHVEPMFVLSADIARIADAFPIKVLELRDRSRVLAGINPFENVEVDRKHLRLRLEQETRNHLIRMRRQWLMSATDGKQLAEALTRSCAVFDQALLTFWTLKQPFMPAFRALPNAADAASSLGTALGLDLALLAELSAFRVKGSVTDVEALFFRHLELLRQLADGVDSLEDAP